MTGNLVLLTIYSITSTCSNSCGEKDFLALRAPTPPIFSPYLSTDHQAPLGHTLIFPLQRENVRFLQAACLEVAPVRTEPRFILEPFSQESCDSGKLAALSILDSRSCSASLEPEVAFISLLTFSKLGSFITALSSAIFGTRASNCKGRSAANKFHCHG